LPDEPTVLLIRDRAIWTRFPIIGHPSRPKFFWASTHQ
jgi:hypothetical protein